MVVNSKQREHTGELWRCQLSPAPIGLYPIGYNIQTLLLESDVERNETIHALSRRRC